MFFPEKRFIAIQIVSDDGVADRLHVDAYLMRSPRMDRNTKKRDPPPAPQDAVLCSSRLPLIRHRHADSMYRISADREINCPRFPFRRSADDSEIFLSDASLPELFLQSNQSGLRTRDDEKARCRAVKPVYDPGPQNVADVSDIGIPMQKPMHERSRPVSRGRMNDDSGRLGYDEYVVVFKKDIERNIFRSYIGRTRRRNGDGDLHPRKNSCGLFDGIRPVNPNVSVSQQILYKVSGEPKNT